MKKVLVIVGVCILIGYLAFSAFYFKEKPKDGLCTQFDVVVNNSEKGMQFINTDEIVKYVNEKGLNPKGKPLRDINTDTLEQVILNNQLIKVAQAYITNNGGIKVAIEERKPILRIIPNTGESYYIDYDGNKMPLSKNFTAYLPIASGAIKEDFAKGDLYNFTLFLRNDDFWNAQIEQIVVLPNNEVRLIPRVGDQQIIMGQLNDYREKLEKLMTFYRKGLNETGWNKYSLINLKYNKQVVCTKR